MRLIVLLLLLVLPAAGLLAQQQPDARELPYLHRTTPTDDELTGVWTGELLQNEGGIADRFEFSMKIQQNGIFLRGTSYVKHGEIYVEMRFNGYQLPSGSWKFTETEIIRGEKPEDLSWCMKQMELRLSYTKNGLSLHGPWWGDSAFGPCVPGSVRLHLKRDRA